MPKIGMCTPDWIGLDVQAASDIIIDSGRTILAGTVLKVLGAHHVRLQVIDIEDCPHTTKPMAVSMGAVKILPRS